MEDKSTLRTSFAMPYNAVPSEEKYVGFADDEFEKQIRKQHCWWLPITLPQRIYDDRSLKSRPITRNTSTGRLPSDVALWLVELRHSSDSDELLNTLKLNVECENVASEVWLHDSGELELGEDCNIVTTDCPDERRDETCILLPERIQDFDSLRNADVIFENTNENLPCLEDKINCLHTIRSDYTEPVKEVDISYQGNVDLPIESVFVDDRLGDVLCCSRKAEATFSWNLNPTYCVSGIGVNVVGEEWQCRGDCTSGRETRFRKLCRSALEELGALLNSDSPQGVQEISGDNIDCDISLIDPRLEDKFVSVRDKNSSEISNDDTLQRNSNHLRSVDLVLNASSGSAITREFIIRSDISVPYSSNTELLIQKELKSVPLVSDIRTSEGGLDNHGFKSSVNNVFDCCNDSFNANESTMCKTLPSENNAMNSLNKQDFSDKCNDVLLDLECMMHSLQGMEDDSSNVKSEILEKDDVEFLLLCNNADNLIEETLKCYDCSWHPAKKSKPESVASSSFSDDVFLSSPLPVTDDTNVFLADTPVPRVTDYHYIDINSIFDDGTKPPIPPLRKKKKDKSKSKTAGFEKCNAELNTVDKCEKVSVYNECEPLLPQPKNSIGDSNEIKVFISDNQCQEPVAKTTAGFSKERRQTRTISYYEDADSCCQKHLDTMSSVENVSVSEKCDMASRQVDTSSTSSPSHVVCSEFNSPTNSTLLEVCVSQTRPISSFEFPPSNESACLRSKDSSQSLNSFGRAVKQPIRPVTSLEDFSSSAYDDVHPIFNSLDRSRKGSHSSDIAAWKQDLQRSGFFSQDDDCMQSDEWFSSADHEGRVYFFEENSSESSWTLPKISIDECDDTENKTLPEVPDTLLRIQDGEKRSVHRITKARSMLVSDQKQRESTNKSSSIPRNFLQDKFLQSGILKEGQLNRTKITENGKKVRKNWSFAYVVLGELYLIFYKDSKSSSGLPEIIIELTTARLETGEKMSKRKNVFLVSTADLQVLCQCDDMQQAKDWCSAIKEAIANLNRIPSKSLHPYSQEEQKKSPIGRSRSLRVKNQDGSVEDHISSNEEQQTKIRDRLRRFFHRRPTRETLASQGIYKDEPVFDNHLEKVCSTEPPYIPKFVKLCIAAIEGKEENMKTDGLYRASGNLSHVQKIRLEVDQNNLAVLEKEDDVHVLTGALKLFFRELKEPLIPYEVFTTALETGEMNRNKNEKIQNFKEIVKQLPQPNHDTLKFLLQHLRRVTEYTEFNRMHIPNLAIVFGPTLIWREKEYHQNMALEYMQQNLVIEFFLQQFDEIFK